MNWEAIGAVGEIIGAIAVVVTLLYLAVQTRQNNVLLREQARYQMLQNQLSVADTLAREPDLVNVVYGIPISDAAATLEMRRQMHAVSILARWHWEYLRAQEGIFGTEDLPVASFRRDFEVRGYARYWGELRHIFRPEFVRFVEEQVASTPPAA